MNKASTALPRRRFIHEMPDKGLFGVVAVCGFAFIIALKLYGFDSDIVAGLAVALMVGYGIVAYRIPAVHIRLDRLGDNFYYLGFIFTLASMSAALIQLRANPNIDAILGSFGIALFTTIVGVAGRVLFTQMRSEMDEVEATIRRDVLAASNDLKAQLTLSLREFETFHKRVQQVAKESLDQSEGIIDKQVWQVGNAARVAAEQITEAFGAHKAYAKSLMDAISEIAEAVDKLTKRLAAVELPTKEIEKQFASFATQLEGLVKRISASLEEVTRQLNAVSVPAKRIEDKIESFGAELERRLLARLAAVVEETSKLKRKPWFRKLLFFR